LPANQGLPIVRNLLSHSEDVGDVHLPLLLWWAIEAKCKSDSGSVVALFENEQLWSTPMVEQHILERVMRRFAMADTRKDFVLCARLFELAPDKSHTRRLMAGFEAAFSGRSLASLPDELVRQLDENGGGSIVLGLRQGKPKAVAEALKVVGDTKADSQKRFDYVGIFGEVKQPKCIPVLLDIVENTADDRLRMAALTALPQYGDANIGTRVIGAYGELSDDVRSTAHSLLSSRAAWTQQLLEAVEAGKVDKGTIPIDVVRKMTIHRGQRIAKLIATHWGKIEGATTEEMQAAIAKYNGIIGADAGDPYRGKVLYKKNCGKCHILFGEGGKIGPDLTAFKRDDLRNMLANVINPSAEIREGFETYLIITEDGRAVSGFLVDRDNKVLVLRGQDGQNVTIAQDAIEEMVPQKKSLMPEGQLKQLTDQQVRDLFAYLRSAQPLNN
jgi:putative heme-binding domain-containing protein